MKIGNTQYTIGADPELFVSKNGQFISAHELIPGTKVQPHKVDKGAVQVDGMAVEYNIDPASSFEEFDDNLTTVQTMLGSMIGSCELMKAASVAFDKEFLKGLPGHVKFLGCSSDFNGWTESENPSPKASSLMRTAGGHIHIGGFFTNRIYRAPHFRACARLARILDETVGIPSLLWDANDERRAMYGKAGCFRPKTYGMEYRTLSNAWIFHTDLRREVYDGTFRALQLWAETEYEPLPIVEEIINTSDRQLASTYLREVKAA